MASKRLIVVRKRANEFIENFAQKLEKLQWVILYQDTDKGSLVNFDGLEKIGSG